MRDMVAKGRGRNHGGLRGSDNPAAKLTPEDVDGIRFLYSTGRYSQDIIGWLYGIAQSQVSEIVRRESWA
jgi:hypothetical protein